MLQFSELEYEPPAFKMQGYAHRLLAFPALVCKYMAAEGRNHVPAC